MTVYSQFNIGGNGNKNPFGSIGALVILVLLFVSMYFIAKGLFTILSWVAPVLLILSLVIDYRAALDYVKFLWKLIRTKPVWGIIATILTVIGYPVAAGFIFFKALINRKIGQMKKAVEDKEGEFTEYEEVKEDEDFLELPPLEKPKAAPKAENNEYDDLFS